jgi:hypothetical protein
MFVDDAPVPALLGKDVGGAAVNLTTAAKLHSPVKRGYGHSATDGDVRLFDVISKFRGAFQVVDEGLAESSETANALVLGGGETHEAAVEHLKRTAQIAVVDGPDLRAFELKDLLSDSLWHGYLCVIRSGEEPSLRR